MSVLNQLVDELRDGSIRVVDLTQPLGPDTPVIGLPAEIMPRVVATLCACAGLSVERRSELNAAALKATIETGEAHYWSRSRREMWRKGGTSGHVQRVREVRLDCDQDAVLLLVEQEGPGACHVGYRACFFRRVAPEGAGGVRLEVVEPKAYDPGKVYGSGP